MEINKKTEELEDDDAQSEKIGKPFGHQVWMDKVRWEKLKIIKDEIGSWNRFTDIACEQLLASGLISKESQELIHKLNREYDFDHLDDSNWRDTFEIRETAPKARVHLRKIAEDLDKLNLNLTQLTQGVEDHAMAMIVAEEEDVTGS